MPLKLIAPNSRRSPFWTIIGTPYKGARQIERSTGTANKREAEAALNRVIAYYESGKHAADNKTFLYASEAYKKWKKPKPYDVKRIDDICFLIGDMPCADIGQDTVVEVAHHLHAKSGPATINRNVLRPLAAVVHYAAKNKWCPYIRFDAWKEPKPVNKTISHDDAEKLLVEVRKPPRFYKKEKDTHQLKEILILWFLRHGSRISETLGIEGKNIDLKNLTFSIYRGKTETFDTFDLDEEIAGKMEKAFPDGLPRGNIFPWKDPYTTRRWIRRLANKAKVHFTPHMGRHTVGTAFKDLGAPLKVTMSKLGHKSYKSSLRYQADDIETVRSYSKKMKKYSG